MENYLTLYLRDELSSWYTLSRKTSVSDTQLRDHVLQNVDLVTRRIQGLSCKAERERSPTTEGQRVEPVYQTLLDLISQAVNPLKLAQMDIGFMPQL